MPTSVKNCTAVTDCSLTSWDLVFCICHGGSCVESLEFSGGPTSGVDDIASLVGQYTTDWSSSGTAASTGHASDTWASPSNAQHDDGSFATNTTTGVSGCVFGGHYIVLTGGGLSVPAGASIKGFAVAIKGKCPGAFGIGVELYNLALVLGGTLYYMADPTGDLTCASYSPTAPYIYTQPLEGRFPVESPATTIAVNSALNAGSIPGCTPGAFTGQGPAEKGLTITPVKTVWTDSDVNDASFGVAFSIFDQGDPQTIDLDAVGLAVYYTPGAGGGGATLQPNLCINS